MRLFLTATISAFLGAVLCTPVFAGEKQDIKTRRIMHEFANCVVAKHSTAASNAVLAVESNATIMRHYPKLTDEECLGKVAGDVQMTLSGDLFLYALADSLVNSSFASQGPTSFTDRLPLAHPIRTSDVDLQRELAATKNKQKQADIQSQFRKDAAFNWLGIFGECVVRQDPENARLWLLTPADKPEEISRINALQQSFRACLTSGSTMRFSGVTLRGTVAINYYRLAMATPVMTVQKVK